MQQSLQDYDDMFAGMSEDIMKDIFIRFYTMEDYFEFSASEIQDSEGTNPIQTQNNAKKQTHAEEKTIAVSMFYNRVISQCICDLHIMNKLINAKAKVVNALLDNGITIAKKKSSHWSEFISEKGFEKLKTSYSMLPAVKKNIIKYAVMSISNLLLKLSLNMSKVSVIPLQKFVAFQCLNIPVLSIIFLQYLQFNLFKSKNIADEQQQVNFFRQLPKLTFIKFNYYKNNTDLQQLENSQQQFITRQTKQTIKNMQYIEIHQKSHDPIMPQYQRKTTYEYIHCIDLEKMSKGVAVSPFKFQMLQLMRQVVFPLVKDFKPDLIVYMESYPSGTAVMDDEIRGLMICEMAQQTCCNKMYVFKELGLEKLNLQKYREANKQGEQINQQNIKIFEDQQSKIVLKYKEKMLLRPEDKKNLEKMKKVFINQLCYISLALIQKTTFEKTIQDSHRYFYKRQFLEGIISQQQRVIQNVIQKNDKNREGIATSLKIKMQGVKMMLEMLKFKQQGAAQKGYKIINLLSKQNLFNSFYNLQQQCVQSLIAESQNSINKYYYEEDDNFIVKYYDNQKRLLAIIIKYVAQKNCIETIIMSKTMEMKTMKEEVKLQFNVEDNYIQGATYVCSNDFLYRGFGKFRVNKNKDKEKQKMGKLNSVQQAQYNKAVHRLKINPQIGKSWELVDNIGTIVKPDGKEEPKTELQKKMHGYGVFDADNKSILMMGGYVDSHNQQKISKRIYIIKNADFINGKEPGKKICMLGKTNKIIYHNIVDVKNMFLNPFVYGVPFFFNTSGSQKGGAFVLNSNGYYLNLNHNNKIFTTLIKLSQVLCYNGINIQNKLSISQNLEDASIAIFLAELLIKCIVFFPHQINIKGNKCCIQTLQEGLIIIEANLAEKTLKVNAPQVFEDNQTRKLQFI